MMLRNISSALKSPKLVLGKFGKSGREQGLLSVPHSATTNSKSEILICDTWNNRIQIFAPNGRFIKSFGSEGRLKGQFRSPEGITVDSEDNIYVTDTDNNRVQIFNGDGSGVINVIGREDCKGGKGYREFHYPRGVTINPHNQDLLVADWFNGKIKIFDKKQRFIRDIVFKGGLSGPNGVAVNSKGEILTIGGSSYGIGAYNYGGEMLRNFARGEHELWDADQLCVDEMDNIYVGSSIGTTIKAYSWKGDFLMSAALKQNGNPRGVSMKNGSMTITDSSNHVVYFF